MSDSMRPLDCCIESPLPGSSVHGILQARILEWVTIPFSRGSCQPRDQTQVPCTAVRFFTNMGKNLPAVQETQIRSLSQEDPLEKGMVTHSSILAWRIPWTEEPGRLRSIRFSRVRHEEPTDISFQ